MNRCFSTGALCVAVLLVGCDSSNIDALESRLLVADNNITDISIIAPSTVIEVDGDRSLRLDGTVGDTETVVTNSARWTSSDTSVLTVSSAGVVTGITDGTATVTATLGPLRASIELRASSADLVAINVTSDATDGMIDECTNVQFNATGDYSDGETDRPISELVEWSLTAGNIGAFDSSDNGFLRSNNAGAGTVTAALGGEEGNFNLTVDDTLASIVITSDGSNLSSNNNVQYTATGSYGEGADTVDISNNSTWTLDATFASVSNVVPNRGLVTATTTGNETLTASCGGQMGSLDISSGSATVITELFFNLTSPSRTTFSGLEELQINAFVRFENGTRSDVTEDSDWIEISNDSDLNFVDNREDSKGLVTIREPGRLVFEARYLDEDNDPPITRTSRFTVIRDAP
jgi:hypothetical protein